MGNSLSLAWCLNRFLVLVGMGIGIPLAFLFAVSAFFSPWTTHVIDVERGKEIFEKMCNVCHAMESGSAAKFGPNLSNIALIAETRRPGMTAEQYILESIIDPGVFKAPGMEAGMPQGIALELHESTIRNLVAFLAGQGKPRDFLELDQLIIPPRQSSETIRIPEPLSVYERGFFIFKEVARCTACHSLIPVPGGNFIAPSLAQVGLLSEDYIRESILNPSARIVPGYQRVQIQTSDGVTLRGRLFKKTDHHIEILHQDRFGHYELRPISLAAIAINADGTREMNVQTVSLMPPYQLSPPDLDALIHFLKLFAG